MIRRPPRSTRTDTLFPYTTLFRSVTGERTFALPRDAYDRFAAALAPYRPESGEVRYEMGSDNCGMAPTDQPSADVTWTSATGASGKLHFYYGCTRDNRSEEHTSELQSLMRISYAVLCLKKKKKEKHKQ